MRYTPDYLHSTVNGSDKVYVICPLPNKKVLIGWGERSPGSSGTWKVYPEAHGSKKRAEKTGKGYKPCPHTTIPQPMMQEMLQTFQREAGIKGSLMTDGSIEAGAGAAPAAPKAAGPKRPKGKDRINVWI